ncbi:hypothetical protein DH09_02680 [Bacillaceae bacterium JMAK1]|nr:hypothetical protein DH09_02680 [Bacillaceae bacterium JMAK1]
MVIVFVLLVVGLVFGSFFSVIATRVPNGESIVAPRSHCRYCLHTLQWTELIPLWSFVWQRGKCTQCKASISMKYPLIECTTAILFVLAFVLQQSLPHFMFLLLLFSLCILVTATDLYKMMIPNRVLLVFFCYFLLHRSLLDPFPFLAEPFIMAFLVFVGLWVIMILSHGGIGGGDVKLFTVLAIALGSSHFLVMFMLATLFGSVYGLLVIKKRSTPFPFAPWIALATLLTVSFQGLFLGY